MRKINHAHLVLYMFLFRLSFDFVPKPNVEVAVIPCIRCTRERSNDVVAVVDSHCGRGIENGLSNNPMSVGQS